MNCLSVEVIDDYLDGLLGSHERAAVEAHASSCAACQGRIVRERDLREQLRGLPVPPPDMRVFERAIARAAEQERARRSRRGRTVGWALAASVVAAIGVSLQLQNQAPRDQDLPGVTIALHGEHEVDLSVESARRLDGATFTVRLPEGIELSGHPGQREIRWTGDLEPGQNLLALPLRAEAGRGGELVALVTHLERSRVFVLNVQVKPEGEITEPAKNVIM